MFRACVSVSKSVSYWNLKIAVAGTGYVEVVGACLAENGNEVVCVDKEASWFRMMRAIEERNQAHKARLLGVIFNGRNFHSPEHMRALGCTHFSIGR